MKHQMMLLAVGVAGVFVSGCVETRPPEPQPLERAPLRRPSGEGNEIQVTIHNGVISADLDRRHELDQYVAAAEGALRSRGFVTGDGRGRLEEPLRVIGRMGGAAGSRSGEVQVLIGPSRVRFEVAIRPWGNDAEGRAVMKRMLELLGY